LIDFSNIRGISARLGDRELLSETTILLEVFIRSQEIPLMNRTAAPPKLDAAGQAAFIKKALELAPKYRTELLKPE